MSSGPNVGATQSRPRSLTNGAAAEFNNWRDHTRVFLQPIAASAVTAFYGATAMMLSSTFGRTILPIGKYRKAANVPGQQPVYPIEFALGEPGVKHGQ